MNRAGGIPTIASIKQAVAREYGVTVEQLSEPKPVGRLRRNTWPISRPRQAAMALAYLLTEHGNARIGYFFGRRDHTTVIHARRAVALRRRHDPKLHEAMRRISLELVRG